jgi:hypothetical protein
MQVRYGSGRAGSPSAVRAVSLVKRKLVSATEKQSINWTETALARTGQRLMPAAVAQEAHRFYFFSEW